MSLRSILNGLRRKKPAPVPAAPAPKPVPTAPAPKSTPQAAAGAPLAVGIGGVALEGFDDPSRAIRFGYLVIVLGFGAFLVWAVLAPIDEGVPAQGTMVVESRRKTVAHLTGGTVATVQVRENDLVKEGHVLLTLDSTRAQTAHDTVLNDYINAMAKLARLTAEQQFSSRIEFPEELVHLAEQEGRTNILRAQEELVRVRQQAFVTEQNIIKKSVETSLVQAEGARQQLAARNQQTALLSQEIASNSDLVAEGYTPRNRLLEQQRQLEEIASTSSDLRTRVAREEIALGELRLRMLQRRHEYLKDVETQLNEARREVANLGERFKDARLDLDRTAVRAPVSGQVVALLPQAPGTVITPGAKLMEIVPQDDRLLFDVQVPVNVIDRVRVGLDTDIRIMSFIDMPNLIIGGRVLSLASDRSEPTTGLQQQPYYLARVEVTPEGIAKLRGRHLRAGMSADVVIRTGERSFLTYLMAPFTRQLFRAFKEP